ncbi:type VI secretion system baseplate subunit TssF [Moritella sp. 5]|uniref:type VI secretion system baseplate subunit TssF n=1 Tax=Moritella sp. 5 TaxID=2746231 RepID=UPI001BA59091|nr:type VI secretion system baseplate subunit TssF [Moritella sp. 5]QUM80162.1 type VI secretion system baseplate subunit TssF [Moritella sp. 5]
MSNSRYFQSELTYLKEAGNEFSKQHPQLANFLSESTYDPDVERLLEGFAFLTGRIREKIDDEYPELTQSLMTLLWPHYTRSIPSMCIAQLTPNSGGVTEKTRVASGVEMASKLVDGTKCIFKTCYNVDLYPIQINSVKQENSRSSSVISLNLSVENDLELARIGLDTLRFYLNGERYISMSIFLWLFRYLDYIELDTGDGSRKRLPASMISPVGYSDDESLLPYGENSFAGYRLLQEYFSLPEKFMFFDLNGLDWLKGLPQRNTVKISFVFSRALPLDVVIKDKHFKLNCTPIVNLFDKDADPIRVEHKQTQYKVRPQSLNQDHYEVYSINNVDSWDNNERKRKQLLEFESFEHQVNTFEKQDYYKSNVAERASGSGFERYISFYTHQNEITNLSSETVLMKLTCSNANLPERLIIGDITYSTQNSPGYASFTNISKPTASVSPNINGALQWQLISNMSLNYLSLTNIDALKVLLSTYDFNANSDRQSQRTSQQRLDGIKNIFTVPIERIYKGVSIRGMKIKMDMNSSMFTNEGDMFLFASVLNEFIRLYASINSFTELEVENVVNNEVYNWSSKVGQQPIL